MIKRPLINPKYYLAILLVSVCFFCFHKLALWDISDWDEARNGVNAFEMLHNHDYFNLYYAHRLDTWNNKPPLFIWLIAVSYKIWGFNAFALRFPSAIATVLFFAYFFKLVKLYQSELFAFTCSLILLSCKGILGFHVARNGDFDATLILFEIAAIYYFLSFLNGRNKNHILFCGLFFGLAFWAKGTAFLLLIPGLILYLVFAGKIKTFLAQKGTWLSIGIFTFVTAAYFILSFIYAKTFDSNQSFYHNKNAVETMLFNDTYQRFFDINFGNDKKPDYFYVFHNLDARFNIWNYVLYLTLIVILLIKLRRSNNPTKKIELPPLLSFSLILFLSIAAILTISADKKTWYLAPAIPFASIITGYGIFWFIQSYQKFKLLPAGLMVFLLFRHYSFLTSPFGDINTFWDSQKESIKSADRIFIEDYPSQSLHLLLLWTQKNVFYRGELSELPPHTIVVFKDNMQKDSVDCFRGDCFVMK